MIADDFGLNVIDVQHDNFRIKKALYMITSTPETIDGLALSEDDINSTVNRYIALMRGALGYNFARDKLAEFSVNAASRDYIAKSRMLRTPQSIEGQFVDPANWQQIDDINKAIDSLTLSRRRQISAALDMFFEAFESDFKLLLFWISLKLLLGGTAPKIKGAIKDHYKIKRGRIVEEDWGFEKFENIRHNFVHHGRRAPSDASLDRYSQVLFLDLIRHVLGLPCKENLRSLIKSGISIAPLGIVGNASGQKIPENNIFSPVAHSSDDISTLHSHIQSLWDEWLKQRRS